MNRSESTLGQELAKGLAKCHNTKGGTPLFFEENPTARDFADLFSIPEENRPNFYEAFKIVTQGQGEELNKINSLISSALLSLLTFYPLFENDNKERFIEIDGERYYKCFFEVKNQVIRLPSCVDIVLISTDETKMLLLESKFTEYVDGQETKHAYGKGYKPLYKEHKLFEYVLSDHLKLDDSKDNVVLQSLDETTKVYIEGIKQSISHLIGLVKGPDSREHGYYPKEYCEAYKSAFEKASVLQYATVLFNPREFSANNKEFENYCELYKGTIINNRTQLMGAIKDWNNKVTKKSSHEKTIIVLDKILTYQDLFSNNHNRSLLTNNVLNYYKL